MANTFTVSRSVQYGGMHMRERIRMYGVLVIDTTASGGAVAGDLPANMFGGLRTIESSGGAVLSDNTKVYQTVPAFDNGSLLVIGDSIGAEARNLPTDLPNGSYNLMVEGIK